MNVKRYRSFALFLVLVLALLGGISAVFAQQGDAEPNNTCLGAQDVDFSADNSPFLVEGELSVGDVDFFRLHLPPSNYIKITLEGAWLYIHAPPPLGDPVLGVFDSNCKPLSYNDDSGSLNSQIAINVPADGVLIVAATGFDDFGFNGTHIQSGGYYLSVVSPFTKIGSISGRLMDAATGNITGCGYVDLMWCSTPDEAGSCTNNVNWGDATYDGSFYINADLKGQPLPAGTYMVVAHCGNYQDNQVGPFAVGQGENYKVGDIALTPNPSIGSISGRVVDAESGVGLSGQEYPFAYVYLTQCGFSCGGISETATDNEGRFTFNTQIPAGDYTLVVTAQNYQQVQQEVLSVQEYENRDIGNVPLQLYPIKFSVVRPCGSFPAKGGTCRYSVRVTNLTGKQMSGAAWSIVNSSDLRSLGGDTTFQTANPTKMTLKPGASRVVDFQFYVPSSVREGTNICADALFGQDINQPYFNLQGRKNLLCIGKGVTSFSILSKQESQTLSRERQHPPLKGLKPGKNRR
ncbi:carboxypeptidase-like regulatory domain-containing protein [Methyloterricola oryzae]|uniref:carboxypeptidase-like regulatory domain-containing protein n=1 Tax=Methyloterricola oryzae TaxID=1495050 RepID=UPI0013011CF8|nr:carboxypeptidase-like regulatory domain-containing protein [Methyloterricola oryzae]